MTQTDATKLSSPTFLALLGTQFLGATNDNVFRWLAIGVGKQYVGATNPATILMAGTACFVIPYLLLAALAGYLADRFSKRSVIVWCKVAEILIMSLGLAAILAGSLYGLFAVVALMGSQSALFSPSKSGSIPEMLSESKISAANGLFGLATVTATVIGTLIGNELTDLTQPKGQGNWWMSCSVLVGIATLGLGASLFIKPLTAANPTRRFPWDAPVQTWRDLAQLASSRPLMRVALGIAFFWSLGTLANLNIDQFAFAGGAVRQSQVSPLLAALVVGIGLGSVLAGYWSGGRVELGILPLGAFGLSVFSILLFTVRGILISPIESSMTISYIWACGLLFLLGISAGLFHVPLEAFIQHRSPAKSRGAILAAANFVTFLGILLASLLFWGIRHPWQPPAFTHISSVSELNVDPATETRITEIDEAYRRDFSVEQPPLVSEYLSELSGDGRRRLAARIIWTEFELRSQNGNPSRSEVAKRFDEYPLLVAEVAEEAGGHAMMNPRDVFLLCGLLTIPVLVYIVCLVPEAMIRFIVWLLSHTLYRIRVHGADNVPSDGGALLVPNHISWLDGIFLMLVSSRPVRMFVWEGNFKNPILLWMANLFGAILVSTGPKSITRALQTARQALNDGELVGIFPEGGISRHGQIQGFRPGMLRILKGTDAPVVPVYLDELWGSIFSFQGGRFFWKWPRKVPYPVSIHFGKPMTHVKDMHEVRQTVMELGIKALSKRQQQFTSLPRAMVRMSKKRKFKSKVADSSGVDLTGAQCLLRTLILRRLVARHVVASDEQYVGVLLPPSVGGVMANMALALDQRVAINLNYTVSSAVLNECIAVAGIKHVLTSRRFMSKMDFQLNAELVYLEDFKDKPTWADKVISALAAYVVPSRLLERGLQLHQIAGDDVATVIFTSGSTGTPKGVVLTYDNIVSNVEAIDQVVHLNNKDVMVGILPFFHSFGYTVTMWTPLGLNVKAVYHYSPIDGKRIGKLAEEHAATILLSTPTFFRNYLKRCTKAQFAKLDVVVGGAEKLPPSLCDAFEEKFGIRPVEGYGCTELSPLAAVNVPPSRAPKVGQSGLKEGTVGRTVPGVAAKVIDLKTGEDVGPNQEGMLMIKGRNVMKGYLGQPERTAEVIRDGWYVTGDIALIDDEGFIKITGRESRFSKIGGEMVPHIQVEDTLNDLIGVDEEEGIKAAVSAVPDQRKGERLVVLHTRIDKSPTELCEGLAAAGLPNLYIPSMDSFAEVANLPLLGSGKLDLKAIKQLAMDQFAGE